ncbi:MAG: hypothetical protein DMF97_07550 [Acidobacteria bacterium]|nr:MAG: hypothetical protein DMF97_07550 [Acidobacteriota bacterium]
MPRPRFVAIWSIVLVGTALALWYSVSPRAHTGPAVRSEHWPELGLDPHEVVFENGFRIVLIEDHRVPRVAASLQYRFGALSERNGEHGSAHFLEHAMHQGTTTVGVKDRDVDRKLLRAIYGSPQRRARAQRVLRRRRLADHREGAAPSAEAVRAGGRAVEEPDFLGGVQLVPPQWRHHAPRRSRAREHRQRAPENRSRPAERAHGDVLPARSRPHGQRGAPGMGGAAVYGPRAVLRPAAERHRPLP